MSLTSNTFEATKPRLRYHLNAYKFVFDALRHTQESLERTVTREPEDDDTHIDDDAHISGQELLHGARELALERFGLMSRTVFRHWGINETGDFGRIVFELIERGEMRKTDRDQLSDFVDVFDFDEAFDRNYRIDSGKAFQ